MIASENKVLFNDKVGQRWQNKWVVKALVLSCTVLSAKVVQPNFECAQQQVQQMFDTFVDPKSK